MRGPLKINQTAGSKGHGGQPLEPGTWKTNPTVLTLLIGKRQRGNVTASQVCKNALKQAHATFEIFFKNICTLLEG